jgi:hypothetical protein
VDRAARSTPIDAAFMHHVMTAEPARTTEVARAVHR